MDCELEDVRWAFKIFMYLIKEGSIPEEERDYHYAYQRNEVRHLLVEIVEEEAEVKIFSLGGVIYLTPGVDNWFLGYSNAQLRDTMNLRDNRELYMAYLVILCLLSEFYQSQDQSMASRQFLGLEELEAKVTGQVEQVTAASEEEVEDLEERLDLRLSDVAALWEELPPFDEELENMRRGRNNRISFILRVISFLEDEGLVQVLEDREIRLLPKLEHLILNYFFHSERKDQLLKLVEEGLMEVDAVAANQQDQGDQY